MIIKLHKDCAVAAAHIESVTLSNGSVHVRMVSGMTHIVPLPKDATADDAVKVRDRVLKLWLERVSAQAQILSAIGSGL